MELAPLGIVPLGVWIGRLLRPSNSVAHVLHDDDYFHWLYVQVILRHLGVVSQNYQTIIRLSRLSAEWTSGVLCRCPLRFRGVGVRIARVGTLVCQLEWLL